MDQCKLTSEQIRDLFDGQTIRISYDCRITYPASEMISREIELVPEPLRCQICQHFMDKGDESNLCPSCFLNRR